MLKEPNLTPFDWEGWNKAQPSNPYGLIMTGVEEQTTPQCRHLLRRASQTNKIYGRHEAVVPEPD
jgi:hypothetical protein